MTKKVIFGIITAVVLLIGAVQLYTYINSVDAEIIFKDIQSADIKQGDYVLKSVSQSGVVRLRVPKSSAITVSFIGKDSYESSTRTIKTSDTPLKATVQAYYSNATLTEKLKLESPQITTAINSSNPNITTLYSITGLRLYHFGEWATAKLTWNGEENENSDTLKVLLKRQGEQWQVVGKPELVFFKDYYNSVPIDILESINLV